MRARGARLTRTVATSTTGAPRSYGRRPARAEAEPRRGRVYLHVAAHIAAAIAFYERAGFERVREIPNYYRIDGEDYACYVYARFLDRARRAPGAAPSLWLASSLAGLVPAAFRSCFKRRLW